MGQPPLAGYTVVDFSRLFAGPYATMTLADLGADVIKIESPSGDDARQFGPPFLSGEGMNFMALNRNKRSVILDIKTPEGRVAAKRLASTADVVVENFRPGVAAKLGIGYEDLKEENPKVVYCSINGFGHEAENDGRPALDIVLQAMTGVMDRQGRGGRPELLVITVADTYAAALAVQGVLAALLARGRDGMGQLVEITLMEALIAAQAYRIISPAGGEVMLPAIDDTCPYQAFQGADGAWFVIAVVSDNNWRDLCTATGLFDLLCDQELAKNHGRVKQRERVVGSLTEVFKTRRADEWLALLHLAGVASNSVRKVEDLFSDPTVLKRHTIISVEHPTAGSLMTMGSALHLSETPTITGAAAPTLGQHTREVLEQWGYEEDFIRTVEGAALGHGQTRKDTE